MAFEKSSMEAAANAAGLEAACQQDKRSSATISELTALVREQKGRLNELARAKAEQTYEYRERFQQLEMHVNEAKQRTMQFDALKKEKAQLQASLQLQEFLVAGLREELKVCSDSLAQQGTAVAQDRGRLEAKVETLQSELVSVRKELDHNADALRIKTKVIDDQTETVRKLKEAVVERDGQLKETRSELLRLQHELEDQIAVEVTENQSLSDRLRQEQTRKEELKAQIADLQSKLADEKAARVALENHWRQKTNVISAIEKQVGFSFLACVVVKTNSNASAHPLNFFGRNNSAKVIKICWPVSVVTTPQNHGRAVFAGEGAVRPGKATKKAKKLLRGEV